MRLFAAGELSFAFVPSEADEQFRDLVRCVDDVRRDLMRARHRLSKFLLRRGLRFAGRQWTQPHERWLHAQRFDDAPSRAAFIDYCCAVEALVQRRRALIGALEQSSASLDAQPARVSERSGLVRLMENVAVATIRRSCFPSTRLSFSTLGSGPVSRSRFRRQPCFRLELIR